MRIALFNQVTSRDEGVIELARIEPLLRLTAYSQAAPYYQATHWDLLDFEAIHSEPIKPQDARFNAARLRWCDKLGLQPKNGVVWFVRCYNQWDMARTIGIIIDGKLLRATNVVVLV